MILATTSEADLLAIMSARSQDQVQARAAWGELFERHRRYLYAVVSRSYGTFLGEDGTVDLVSDTFLRAFEWAGRQPSPDDVRSRFVDEDPDSSRRRVLGWLGAIARQLFKDKFREAAEARDEMSEFLDSWRNNEENPAEAPDAVLARELNRALDDLSAAEADALRASLPWYDVETRTFAVPRGEAARLAAALNASPDALRQRRHRALERIERHLEECGYALAEVEELQ